MTEATTTASMQGLPLGSFSGRFVSNLPLGFKAGDENLRRYVGNNPTNATDPSGLFQYTFNPEKIIFGGSGARIDPRFPQFTVLGYRGANVYVKYPDTRGAKSFVQVNRIQTLVITVDKEGKVTPQLLAPLFKLDLEPVIPTSKGYDDTLEGPNFDPKDSPNAVMLISVVTKVSAFDTKDRGRARGREIDPLTANREETRLKTAKAYGTYRYAYYWADEARAKAQMTDFGKIAAVLRKDQAVAAVLKEFEDIAKGVKDTFDLKTYTGQFVADNQQIVEADVKGRLKPKGK